jgi:hypothetical protein
MQAINRFRVAVSDDDKVPTECVAGVNIPVRTSVRGIIPIRESV